MLAGPDLKFVCADEDLRPAAAPAAVARVGGGAASSTAGAHHYTRRAPSRRLGGVPGARHPAVSSTAPRGHPVVGVAGASADCEAMWQIGVDVVKGERGRGIGRAVVGRLTAEVLARGRLPYYSTVVSNLRSIRLALGLGYRLA